MSRTAVIVSDAEDSRALCRLCMIYHEYFVNIFIPNDTFRICAEEAIHDLLRLKVAVGDGLPSNICHQCAKKLMEFRDFKEMCLKTAEELGKYDLDNVLRVSPIKNEDAVDWKTSRDRSIHESTFQKDIQVTEVYITIPDEIALGNMSYDVKEEVCSTENALLVKEEVNAAGNYTENGVPLNAQASVDLDPLAVDTMTDETEVYPRDPLGDYDGFVEEEIAETEGHEVAAHCGERKQFAVVEQVNHCNYIGGIPELQEIYFDKNDSGGLKISQSKLLNTSSSDDIPEGNLRLEYSRALFSGAYWNPRKIIKEKKNIKPSDSNKICSQLKDRAKCDKNHKCKQLCHQVANKFSPTEYNDGYCGKRYSEIHSLALHIKGHVDRNASETVLPEKEFPGGMFSNPLLRNGRSIDTVMLETSKQSTTQTNSKNKSENQTLNEVSDSEKIGREITHSNVLLSNTVTPWDQVEFVCDACGMEFQIKSDLVKHINIEVCLSTHKCRVCGKKFKFNCRLKKHEAIHTDAKQIKCNLGGNELSMKHEMANTVLNRFKCGICGKKFKYRSYLKQHSVVHTGEKPFKCKFCGKMFTQSGGLKNHFSIHTGVKSHKCDVCGKMFAQKGNLKAHLAIHAGVKPFKCHFCGRNFMTKGTLNTHLRIHTGVKPYKCDVCGKMFTESGTLKNHLTIHTGVKPHKCVVCGKMFSQKGNLKAHSAIHTGVKPFKCYLCGRNFTTKRTLRMHSRFHTGVNPYKCAGGGKMITQISDLNVHSVANTGLQ